MKSKKDKTYDTFEHYIKAIEQSCPDPYPDAFAHYQAGAWYAEGAFFIKNQNSLPARWNDTHFWAGYDSVKHETNSKN